MSLDGTNLGWKQLEGHSLGHQGHNQAVVPDKSN